MKKKLPEKNEERPLKEALSAYMQRRDYTPQSSGEIARGMGIDSRQRALLRETLKLWLGQGRLLKLQKGAYALRKSAEPQPLTGRIVKTAGGKLLFLPDAAAQEQIATLLHAECPHSLTVEPRRSCGAMDGDHVRAAVRVQGSPRYRRGGKGARRPAAGDLTAVVYIDEILERGHARWVGTYRAGGRFGVMVGDGITAPELVNLVSAPEEHPQPGDTIVVEPVAYPVARTAAKGRCVEVLGDAARMDVSILAIIRKYGLAEDFPVDVLAEAAALPSAVREKDIRGRMDCRKDCIITIDPESARDYDDAITLHRAGGGWQLDVHIADVAHYVRPGTALDAEAQKRGNSTYLPDRVLPMLPPKLCDGICSLRQGEDRLTALCRMSIDARGAVTHAEFAKAVIRSRRRLTYAQALEVLQGGTCGDREVDAMLREAGKLTQTLRARRMRQAALNLDMPELHVLADAEGNPTGVELTESDAAHQLIEECMLAANEAVAHALNARALPAIYRVHEEPDPAKLHEFGVQLRSYGYNAGMLTTREQLAHAMEQVKGRPEEEPLKVALLRCMMRARYSPDPLGHYGLAKGDYCHFTSPIRRYADLVVHRAFLRLAGDASAPLSPRGRLEGVSAHISETERTSAAAETEADRLMLARYLERECTSRQPRVWDGIITACWPQGITVDIPQLRGGVKGYISRGALPGNTHWFYESHTASWRASNGRSMQPGQALKLIPTAVDESSGFVDFKPVEL